MLNGLSLFGTLTHLLVITVAHHSFTYLHHSLLSPSLKPTSIPTTYTGTPSHHSLTIATALLQLALVVYPSILVSLFVNVATYIKTARAAYLLKWLVLAKSKRYWLVSWSRSWI